jgi:iron complex outermembrane receptor protein
MKALLLTAVGLSALMIAGQSQAQQAGVSSMTPAAARSTGASNAAPAVAASSDTQTAMASAPQADAGEPQNEIVVTGFRQSLARAASIKRNEATVSDVIAAEDIGKYPDVNIAESLQRVTGVQITRSRGAGSSISVRGLSPSFVSTELNGRQIVSGGGRAFDFLSLSPDFVSSVVVEKSPTASEIDGGLSATVDVRTPRPLDVNKTTVAGRVEGVYDSLRKTASPRASIIGNWVNGAGTLGVSLGAGYERLRNRTYSQDGYGAESGVEAAKGVDYNRDGDRNDIFAFDHAQSYYETTGVRERYSAIAGLQWRPSDTLELYADGLWTRFHDSGDQVYAATRFTNIAAGRAGQPFGIVSSTVDTSKNSGLLGGAQGFLTSIDADGVDLRADRQPFDRRNTISSGALGAKFTSGRFHLNVEGSYSRGVINSFDAQASAIARASVAITRPEGYGGQALLTFNRGFDPLNPANFAFLSVSRRESYSSDRLASGKADAIYDVGDGFIRKLKAGAYYSDRHLFSSYSPSNVSAAAAARLGNYTYQPGVEGGSISAAPFLTAVTTNPDIPHWFGNFLTFDYDKFYKALGGESAVTAAIPYEEQLGSRLDVTERTIAGYTQADFADSADRLSGNIGVRVVNTRLTSKGYGADLDNLTFSNDGVTTIVPPSGELARRSSYTYALPSLNLRYNVSDRFAARFAAARVLARPDFSQLGVGLSVNANVLNISAANPDLKPYLSNQLDLSLEYYLPKSGLISLAFFYKNVDNFIVNGQVLDTRQVHRTDGTTVATTFRRNQPINLETVNIKGVEFGYSVPLELVTPMITGLGLFGNATYVDAPEVPAEQNGLPFPLPGVSKFSYNVGAYFERWGFGARAYYNWRGQYETGGENFFGDRTLQRAYGQVDGSVSYDVTPKATVSINFANLFDAKQSRVNSFGLARGYYQNGRQFTAGLRARF